MRDSATPMSLQRLLQRVLVEFLGADDVDLADRRTLLHDDDQHVALDVEAHVAKKTGRVQRLDRRRGLLVVDAVADLDRQVAEHRAGVGALHALDADVLDRERLEGERGGGPPRREESKQKRRQRSGARAYPGRSRVHAGVRGVAKDH